MKPQSLTPANIADTLLTLKHRSVDHCPQTLLQLPDLDAARQLALEQPGLMSLPPDTAERKLAVIAAALQRVPLPAAPPASGSGTVGTSSNGAGSSGSGDSGVQMAGKTSRKSIRKREPESDADGASASGSAGGRPGESRVGQDGITWSNVPSSADTPNGRAQADTQAALAEARRMVLEAPTLLTMSPDALPRRATELADALGSGGGAEAGLVTGALEALRACPQLLVLPRSELRYRVQQLGWALELAPEAVRGLVLSRPEVVLLGVQEAREVLARTRVVEAGAAACAEVGESRRVGAGVVQARDGPEATAEVRVDSLAAGERAGEGMGRRPAGARVRGARAAGLRRGAAQ